jgi:dihydroorotase
LSVNSNADICIFDPKQYWKIEASALLSQGKNSPFLGLELAGKVKYTLVNGHIVHQSE